MSFKLFMKKKNLQEMTESHHVEVDNMVLVNGKWYNVVEVNDDTFFATDDEGGEHELKKSDVEKIEEATITYDEFTKGRSEDGEGGSHPIELSKTKAASNLIKGLKRYGLYPGDVYIQGKNMIIHFKGNPEKAKDFKSSIAMGAGWKWKKNGYNKYISDNALKVKIDFNAEEIIVHKDIIAPTIGEGMDEGLRESWIHTIGSNADLIARVSDYYMNSPDWSHLSKSWDGNRFRLEPTIVSSAKQPRDGSRIRGRKGSNISNGIAVEVYDTYLRDYFEIETFRTRKALLDRISMNEGLRDLASAAKKKGEKYIAKQASRFGPSSKLTSTEAFDWAWEIGEALADKEGFNPSDVHVRITALPDPEEGRKGMFATIQVGPQSEVGYSVYQNYDDVKEDGNDESAEMFDTENHEVYVVRVHDTRNIRESEESPMGKRYPDTEQGVLDMIQGNFEYDINNIASITADPYADGVWMIKFKDGTEYEGLRAIVYLAGYGNNEYNDIEVGE